MYSASMEEKCPLQGSILSMPNFSLACAAKSFRSMGGVRPASASGPLMNARNGYDAIQIRSLGAVGNFRSGQCSASFDAENSCPWKRHNPAAAFADCARNILRLVDTGRSVPDLEGTALIWQSQRPNTPLRCSPQAQASSFGSLWLRCIDFCAREPYRGQGLAVP